MEEPLEEPLVIIDSSSDGPDPGREDPVRPASDATVYAICALAWFTMDTTAAFYQLERGFSTNCSLRPPRISMTDIADVNAISKVTWCAFLFGFGFMADRFGRRATLLASTATVVLGGVGMTLAPDWGTFLVGVAMSQAGLTLQVTTDAVMAEMISVPRREKALLFIGTFVFLGAEYADLLRAALVPDNGPQHWRTLTGVLFAPAVLLFVSVVLFLPESPVWLRLRSQVAGAGPQNDTRLSLLQDQPLSQSLAGPCTRLSVVSEGGHQLRESFGTSETDTSDHHTKDESSLGVRWSDVDDSSGNDAEVAVATQTAAGNLRTLLCGKSSGSTLWLIGCVAALGFSSTLALLSKLTAIGTGHEISSAQLLVIQNAGLVAGVTGAVLPAVFVPKYISVGTLFVVAILMMFIADTVMAIGIVHGKSDSRHALFVGVPYAVAGISSATMTGCYRVIVAAAFTPSQRALGLSVMTAVFALTGVVGGYLQAWLLDHVGIVPTALALNIAQAVIAVACYKGHIAALGRLRGSDTAAAAALTDLSTVLPSSD
jgi:MFS family permease